MKTYEFHIHNVGIDKQYPIQLCLEVWDGNMTRRTYIDIPKDKIKEFLDIINGVE